MFDGIIVGARCAGSPTAMLLARKGYRVLLVDRCTFPSDTMSTHYIWQAGTARLHRWGLLDQVRATGCPRITKVTLDFGAFSLSGCAPAAHPAAPECLCPRRTVLDKILIDAARAAGAEVREAFSVREILFDGDRVVGIRGVSRGGNTIEERARVTIGADGLHSFVAGSVRAPKTLERPIASCGYYSYWQNFPTDGVEIHVPPRRTIVTPPTNDGLTCIIAMAPADEFPRFREDIEGFFLASLELVPSLAARVRSAQRVERFVGGAFPNFFRKPHGHGWALVGDAGYHKDPYTAQGISDAFRDADLLSEAIDAGFSGQRPLEDALADYERTRNESALAEFHATCDRAAMEPPTPEMLGFFQALRGNQEQINRLIGLDAGTVTHAEFFSPQSIASILDFAQPVSAQADTPPASAGAN